MVDIAVIARSINVQWALSENGAAESYFLVIERVTAMGYDQMLFNFALEDVTGIQEPYFRGQQCSFSI